MSIYDDFSDPTADIPIIDVHFPNGVHDRMMLKHVTFMPHSTDVDVSRLCNYIGHLENDPTNSIVSVTGCLRKSRPDDRMDIVLFSEHSPSHGYFSVAADGDVISIPAGIQRGGVVPTDTLRKDNGNDLSTPDDDVENNDLKTKISHMHKEDISVPSKLTLNIRMGVDAKANSNIKSVLKMSVDNWIEELLTHAQVHFLHNSLKHQIYLKVSKSNPSNHRRCL